MMAALLTFVIWTVAGCAGWLFAYSLGRLMAYHSRRLSVGTLYMQWERNA